MIWLSRTCRALAVLIAIAAAFDPEIMLTRTERPLVALIDLGQPRNPGQDSARGQTDSDVASELSRALARDFDVNAGPIGGAAATIVIGNALPPDDLIVSGSLFAVQPPAAGPRASILKVTAPQIAPSGSKIPIDIQFRAVGLRGRSVKIDLFAGSLAVDSRTQVVDADDADTTVTMALPPASRGLLDARVVVSDAADRSRTGEQHVVVDVRDQRWRVLVSDPRPSWASTFVRRALEDDRRFDVVSRVATSTKSAAASGPAPALSDVASLFAFDAVIVGAPDAMTASDARALERYARERGGAVVLLLDRLDTNAFGSLLGGVGLTDLHGAERFTIAAESGNQIATELALPRNDDGLMAVARATIAGKERPIVWQSALGAGRVLVNGALDAWRYRVREDGGFAGFWTAAVAAGAAASPARLTLSADSLRVAPGETFTVRAIARDAQLSDPAQPAPAVELSGPPQFWPSNERGVFTARVTAPATEGQYQIEVQGFAAPRSTVPASPFAAELNYIVSAGARADAQRSRADMVAAWTTSRGGTVLDGSIADAVARLKKTVTPRSERAPSRPMRSVWWLPGFVLLVGVEWWLRRRRGEK